MAGNSFRSISYVIDCFRIIKMAEFGGMQSWVLNLYVIFHYLLKLPMQIKNMDMLFRYSMFIPVLVQCWQRLHAYNRKWYIYLNFPKSKSRNEHLKAHMPKMHPTSNSYYWKMDSEMKWNKARYTEAVWTARRMVDIVFADAIDSVITWASPRFSCTSQQKL